MPVCPVMSKKERITDCIGKYCAFFDGCMLLKYSDDSSGNIKLKRDIAYCIDEIQSLEADLKDVKSSLEEFIEDILDHFKVCAL